MFSLGDIMIFLGGFFAFNWLFVTAEATLVMVLELCWLQGKSFLIICGCGFFVLRRLLWGKNERSLLQGLVGWEALAFLLDGERV